MGEHDQTQHHRAVANALWPYLTAHAWRTYEETRLVTPLGNSHSGGYSSVKQEPNPSTYVEVISRTYKIITNLWSDDWHGGTAWRITLEKKYADNALSRLNAATIADYETAIEHATCRKPFTVATDEDGGKYLTRNRNDGLITNLTAAALEALARACELRLIPAEVEAALFTDDDPINLDAIRAALQLAGGEEP